MRWDLADVLNDLAGVIDDSASATRHPLGFVHVELTNLFELGFRDRVRLHLWTDWSREWADHLGAIHDHNWELRSLVLVGGLRDTMLEASASPSGSYVATRVHYGSGKSDMAFEAEPGFYDLVEIGRREILAGYIYRLPPRVLHLSETVREPTATLVRSTKTDETSAVVYRPKRSSVVEGTTREYLTTLEVRRAIGEAIEALTEPQL